MDPNVDISNNVIGVFNDKKNVNIKGDVIVYGSDKEDLQYVELDVPPLSKTFQGREEDMQHMDNLLFSKNRRKLVISGLPGYGKSELAKQYANICLTNKKVDKIFWINAENPGNFQSVTLRKAYLHFNDKRCMFIFDNGVKLEDIHEHGPPDKKNFYLLITSRESEWGNDIESIKLDALSSDAAIEIYKNILCENFKEEDLDLYKTLTCLVGCVPSDLQNTANCIRQEMKRLGQDFQLEEYVKNLQDPQDKSQGPGSMSSSDTAQSQVGTSTGQPQEQIVGPGASGTKSQPQCGADLMISAMIAKFPTPDDLLTALGIDKDSKESPNISSGQMQELLRLQANLDAMRIEQQAKFRRITEQANAAIKKANSIDIWALPANKAELTNNQMPKAHDSDVPDSSNK